MLCKQKLMDFIINREYNPKCVAITAAGLLLYVVLPKRSLLVGVGLGIGIYSAIGIYDYYYNCDEKLRMNKK